jgi:hypothetical protein
MKNKITILVILLLAFVIGFFLNWFIGSKNNPVTKEKKELAKLNAPIDAAIKASEQKQNDDFKKIDASNIKVENLQNELKIYQLRVPLMEDTIKKYRDQIKNLETGKIDTSKVTDINLLKGINNIETQNDKLKLLDIANIEYVDDFKKEIENYKAQIAEKNSIILNELDAYNECIKVSEEKEKKITNYKNSLDKLEVKFNKEHNLKWLYFGGGVVITTIVAVIIKVVSKIVIK